VNPVWRARLRRLRFALLGAAAACVILLGVLAGLTHLAMPWLAGHPQSVARWLGERLGRPVAIGHLDGNWQGGGPVLTLDDVRIGGADASQSILTIPRAQLAFDLLAPLRRGRSFTEFRIDGLDLRLAKEDGEWKLHGLEFGEPSQAHEPPSMGLLGALELTHARLRIDDAQRDLHVDLAVPVLRLLNRGELTRVLARVAPGAADTALLDVVAEITPATRSGTVYIGSKDVDLAGALAAQAPGGLRLHDGRGLAQFWLQVHAGVVDDVRARVDLRNVAFAAAKPLDLASKLSIEPRAAFERLAFAARWLRDDAGWTLDVADFTAGVADAKPEPARLRLRREGGGDAPQWNAAARKLALEPVGALAMLMPGAPDGLRHWLYLAHPRGMLDDVALRWSNADDYDLRASLRDGEADDAGFAPGIEHLDLDAIGDAQSTLLQLPAQAMHVAMPKVFRRPFALSRLGGDVVVRRTEDGPWRIETDRLLFDGEGYGGELRGGVELASGHRPFLDLYAATSHGEVPAAKLFWPVNVMPPSAVAWLDRALVAGQLVDGRVAIRGDLADWPFHNHAGYFVARGEVDGAVLDYHPQWPRAENIRAVATFINDGMSVDATSATSMGNSVQSASATIPDFGPLVLDLDVKGGGSASSLLTFLRATPVGKRYADPLKDLAVEGKASVGFKMTLPIKQVEALTLDGSGELQASKLEQLRYDQHFSDVSGKLRFSAKGFAADALDTTYRGRKAKLSVGIGAFAGDPAHVFEAKLEGVYPPDFVFADVPVLAPVVAHMQGESAWTANVSVDEPRDGVAPARLALDSDLVGTAIDLPVPLEKPAAANWPLHVALDLPYAGQRVRVRLADVLAVAAQLPAPDKAFGMRLRFGADDAGDPPAADIVVEGRAAHLDAGTWLNFMLGGPPGSGTLVRSIDVRGDDVLLGGRHFDNVHVSIDNLPATTRVGIDSTAIAGQIEIPRADSARGIAAKFERVHWPEAPPGAADASALSDIAPASLPPIHLAVDDFQLGTASFGSAKFESRPAANGMTVDSMETHSPNVTMTAKGEWTGTAASNRSKMAISLKAQSLGRMMDALGFPGLIDGGETQASIDASWPGPPSAFALANLDGSLDIDIAEGRIPDAHPGAGRIFGLLSITEIPRRLSLDFSDFFQSGLGFNSIKGKFRLEDGNAFTDGLRIDSPAAEIIVTGRTGLRAKDYDQRLDVEPRAGATLPIVGAIAGGPVGAAAGLVVQGLFKKPLGKAVARRYSVTGTWEKPVFTTIARSRAGKQAPANEPKPAAPPPEKS